jgi:hypothetical protein
VTNLFQLAKKVTNLFQIANKSDELIPNGSVEPVPIDESCRLYSIWHTFELIPNGRVGLVQPPLINGFYFFIENKFDSSSPLNPGIILNAKLRKVLVKNLRILKLIFV